MTIALGMRCMDGMVLCTDSLESDGVTKRLVNKLWVYEVQHLGSLNGV
jgi:20S proteasome alpha/beta subunit